jgi:hypothetical protein
VVGPPSSWSKTRGSDLPDALHKLLARSFVVALFTILPTLASAQAHGPTSGHTDPVTRVVLALAVILTAAKFGGHLAVRMGQPAVLGELVAGSRSGAWTSLESIGFTASRQTPPSKFSRASEWSSSSSKSVLSRPCRTC